jgi:hypothetical protein
MNEILANEVLLELKKILTPNGILISGNGMIANNTDKANEIADKSQKFLYFMESRQKRMEEQNIEIINLLKAIIAKLK